jgi:hypothetical protein
MLLCGARAVESCVGPISLSFRHVCRRSVPQVSAHASVMVLCMERARIAEKCVASVMKQQRSSFLTKRLM